MIRKIVTIDAAKCNGCGLCVKACAEGAIQLVDGKAKLVSAVYCDGLGACLGKCPVDAITVEEREAPAFDEAAVQQHLTGTGKAIPHAESDPAKPAFSGCPGSRIMNLSAAATGPSAPTGEVASELRQWPVQLHLVPGQAPYWQDADLLIAGDCVPFAYAGFHGNLLRGKKLIIACPKLDDKTGYLEKLAAIFQQNRIKSVTVAHMEVPCCTGLVRLAEAALTASGKTIPFKDVTVGIRGQVLGDN